MANPQAGKPALVALDPEATDTGAMERLFLLEAHLAHDNVLYHA